jgi:hypothetical protein
MDLSKCEADLIMDHRQHQLRYDCPCITCGQYRAAVYAADTPQAYLELQQAQDGDLIDVLESYRGGESCT